MNSFVKFVGSLLLMTLSFSATHAAEISSDVAPNGIAYIIIDGEIVSGDADAFKSEAQKYPNALVVVGGPGGVLIEALRIGSVINEKKYSTIVLADEPCASSCGLIWLAGASRIAEPNAKIGFHSGYVEENGKSITSGFANAMIGRYLGELSLSLEATYFITDAPPQAMNWIDQSDKGAEKIEYYIVELKEAVIILGGGTAVQSQLRESDAIARTQVEPPYQARKSRPGKRAAAVTPKTTIPERDFGNWTAMGEFIEGYFGLKSNPRKDGVAMAFLCKGANECSLMITTPFRCTTGRSYMLKIRTKTEYPINTECQTDSGLLEADIPDGFIEDIGKSSVISLMIQGSDSTLDVPIPMAGFNESLGYLYSKGLFGE